MVLFILGRGVGGNFVGSLVLPPTLRHLRTHYILFAG